MELNLKEFFKKIDFTPAADSSGGGDYVDGVDTIVAAKFNDRRNKQDGLYVDLAKLTRNLQGMQNSKISSFLYEQLASDFCASLTAMPFEYIFDSNNPMDFIIKGSHNVMGVYDHRKLNMPTTSFIDFIREGEEEFSITVGNTNLFEVQSDYPTAVNRWYRLGHDGAEGTPALVTVQHAMTASSEWSVVEVIFEDYDNNPTTKDQIIRIKGDDNSEYIELVLDPDQTNYRYNRAVWTGSTLSTLLDQDTGVARSTGIHRFQIVCLKSSVELYVDNTKTTISAGYIQNVDDLEFESGDDSGGADHFDIIRFNVYNNIMLTMAANNIYYVYVDISDGAIKSTTTLTTALSGIILYRVDVPTGASSLISDYVTDLRHLSKFFNEFKNLEDTTYAIALDNMPAVSTGAIDADGQNITNVGTVDGIDISAIALDNMPTAATGAIDVDGQSITNVNLVDGADISALSLSNLPAAASGNIDCGTQAITNVGNVDGVDVSALNTQVQAFSLANLPVAPASAVSFNSQNITSVGTVDGVDISALSLSNLPTNPAAAIGCNGQILDNVGEIKADEYDTYSNADVLFKRYNVNRMGFTTAQIDMYDELDMNTHAIVNAGAITGAALTATSISTSGDIDMNDNDINELKSIVANDNNLEFFSGSSTSFYVKFTLSGGVDFLQISGQSTVDEVLYTNRKGNSVTNSHDFKIENNSDADIYCRVLNESGATLDHANYSAADIKGIDFSKHDWKDKMPKVLTHKRKIKLKGEKEEKDVTYISSVDTLSFALHLIQKQQEEIDSLQEQINLLNNN